MKAVKVASIIDGDGALRPSLWNCCAHFLSQLSINYHQREIYKISWMGEANDQRGEEKRSKQKDKRPRIVALTVTRLQKALKALCARGVRDVLSISCWCLYAMAYNKRV